MKWYNLQNIEWWMAPLLKYHFDFVSDLQCVQNISAKISSRETFCQRNPSFWLAVYNSVNFKGWKSHTNILCSIHILCEPLFARFGPYKARINTWFSQPVSSFHQYIANYFLKGKNYACLTFLEPIFIGIPQSNSYYITDKNFF